VPPIATCYVRADGEMSFGVPTSVIQDALLGPVFNDHSQRADALVNLNVCLDHARILQSEGIVHVHVACELQHWIPHFYDPNLCLRYADDLLHAVC
jgi:hypothetical protein